MAEIDLDEFDDGSDDEEEFAVFNAFVEYLKTLPKPEAYIANPERIHQMRLAFEMIKKAVSQAGGDVVFECRRNGFGGSSGSIRIEGTSIEIVDTAEFSKAANLANNMEVYALLENKVRVALMFYDLLLPIQNDRDCL